VAVLLTALALPGVVPAQPAAGSSPGAFERLIGPETSPDDRALAARVVLTLPAEDPTLSAALALLAEQPGEASRALLAAIARDPQPAPVWYAPCVQLARTDSPLAAEAISALASFRTREAAAVLVEIVADARPPLLQDAAARALTRLTGRDDLTPGQWREWLADALSLSDRQWQRQLLLSHIRRVQTLQSSGREADRQLADAWRQVHLLTPQDQRSDLLVRLLQHTTPALRDLGFDLINREIGESRQLSAAVGQAAISLLTSPEPVVRAQAALLLDRLAPPEAEPAILTALERESDHRAADALLRAASRWPSGAMVKPVLRWLDASPALRLRAASTAWALLRDGFLTEPSDQAVVLLGVRAIETPALTAPACRILATLGAEPDLARLHTLLASEDPALRAIAADALALRPDQTDTLLAAATNDATLFEPTARALRSHLHDARGYAALCRLPSPSPQIRTRALAEYASLLPTPEIIRLARLASDPAEALHLLRPLTAAERTVDPAADPELASQLAAGLYLLVRTSITLNLPADALNALSLLPAGVSAPDLPTATALDDLRATLLLWLNRLDDAEAIEASPNAWLDALDHAITEPHAPAIAARITTRFPDLTPEDAARLAALRQRQAEATEHAPADGG
jgi:hypothetical protein